MNPISGTPPVPPTEAQKTAALAVMRKALRVLRDDARSNPSSSNCSLLDFAHLFCEEVGDWVDANPEAAKAALKQRSCFPVLMGRHPAIVKDTVDQLAALGLGSAHPLAALVAPTGGKRAPKGCDLNVPSNMYAAMIFDRLVNARRNYPELCGRCSEDPSLRLAQWCHDAAKLDPLKPGATAEKWWKVGWAGAIESKLVAKFVESRDGKTQALGQYRSRRVQLTRRANQGSKTQAANIRDGTETKIKAAFLRMARHVKGG